jgi:hypothetical protein
LASGLLGSQEPKDPLDKLDALLAPADFVNPIGCVVRLGFRGTRWCWSGIKSGCTKIKNWWKGVDETVEEIVKISPTEHPPQLGYVDWLPAERPKRTDFGTPGAATPDEIITGNCVPLWKRKD